MTKKEIKKYCINSWSDNTTWFLTDSTYLHFPYFDKNEQKEIILGLFKDLREKFGAKISDYSISNNHYHLKFFLKKGDLMPRIKQFLRGGISFQPPTG
jgi:hypothetical protein